MRLQGSRIEEQRCPLPPAVKSTTPSRHRWQENVETEAMSRDELFDLIFASQVSWFTACAFGAKLGQAQGWAY